MAFNNIPPNGFPALPDVEDLEAVKKDVTDLKSGLNDSEKDIYAAMGEMGAKNLIPYLYVDTTKTVNGITFTDNGDGTITANGTALDTANFILVDEFSFTENESYILTGCPSGGSANTYRQYIITYGGDVGEGKRITPTSKSGLTKQIIIQIFAGTTVSNLTFKPMLRLASDTDNTYQPYAKTNKQLTDEIALKQNATDNNLQTTDKTIVGAVNELKSGLTNIGSSTDLGNVQGSDTITLSNAVTNYRFVQILIGYYASGYPCFGQALLPVSTLFIGSDDIPITVAFTDRTGTTSGKDAISFLSATSAKVVNTSDAVYTKFFGIA